MQIDPRTPTTKNPPEQFTGDVWLDPIARPREAGQSMFVAKVRFAPGARTAWHAHASLRAPGPRRSAPATPSQSLRPPNGRRP